MDLASQIYIRKSCRDYIDGDIDMEDIHDFISHVRPLNDKIGFRHEILKKDEMNIEPLRLKKPENSCRTS